MAALLCFLLALLTSLFKSKSRLEAENAALRDQLAALLLSRPFGGRVLEAGHSHDRGSAPSRHQMLGLPAQEVTHSSKFAL